MTAISERLQGKRAVVTGGAQGIGAAIARIEEITGLPVHAFPKEREYFVEMKLAARA